MKQQLITSTDTRINTMNETAVTALMIGATSGTFNGSANLVFPVTLTNSGLTAGTYTSAVVEAKSRVLASANPSNLAMITALS
jgi:phage-related tail fiber protein